MNNLFYILSVLLTVSVFGCAHSKPVDEEVSPSDAAKFNRKLVRESVVFESGAKEGAVVPEVSAPRLRAMIVPERVENNRLIERHREWILDGEVTLLGIPDEKPPIGGKHK